MSKQPSIDTFTLKKFFPLDLISERYLEKLQEKLLVTHFASGETILGREQKVGNLYHYLLSGEIELRLSFADRPHLDASDNRCYNALNDLLKDGGSIKALSPCKVLTVSISYIDQLLMWSESQEFHVIHLEQPEPQQQADIPILEADQSDWSTRFLNSPLATRLNAASLHKIFQSMADEEIEASTTIIKENSEGNFFYILKSGCASVFNATHGELVTLKPGDYFGDEALIASTIRNATIEMKSRGVIGKLDGDTFVKLVRPHLVRERKFNDFEDDGNLDILDVRLPLEFMHDHRRDSHNIPISRLRKSLTSLDHSKRYLITPEGGKRSELATYLMGQAGYEAYLASNS